MTRLLIVTTVHITISGFLLPFARAFRGRGWKVDAAANGATTNPRIVAEFDRVWDIHWTRNPLNPFNVLSGLRQIREIVAQGQYDIVHVHTPIAAFLTRCALRHVAGGKRPVVIYTAHGFHFSSGSSRLWNLAFSRLERWAGRWTDFLVVINREDEEAAKRHRLVAADRIVYMPGIGVDTAGLRPDTVTEREIAEFRAELGLKHGECLFSVLANFDRRKRQIDAVRALAALRRAGVHLVFAGGGAVPAQVRRVIAESGLADRVHFLGFRADTPAIMRASVATILPSVREGLSRSVMESMCLGVPVIGTRIRGIRELLDHGAGILVEPRDVDGLARAMAWMLYHAEARAMGGRGQEQIAAYDVRKIVELHERLYSRALGVEIAPVCVAAV